MVENFIRIVESGHWKLQLEVERATFPRSPPRGLSGQVLQVI